MAAQAGTHNNTHRCSLAHSHNQPIRPLQHCSGREGSKGLMRGRMGVCKAMLPGYWWAICRLTYRSHSLICLRRAHWTHTSTVCHSCSDSIITPVSGWKMGLYVTGSAGWGVTFSGVPYGTLPLCGSILRPCPLSFQILFLIYCTVLLYICIIQVIFRLSNASSHCVFKLKLCLFLQKKSALAQKTQLNVSDSTGVTEVKFCSINPSLSFWFFSPKLLWCDRFRQQSSSQPVITLYVCLFFFLAIQWGTQTSPDSTHHSLFI